MTLTLAELAAQIAAQLIGDPNVRISGVNTLDEATEKDASFLANPLYLHAMRYSSAGVICVAPGTELCEGRNYLLSDDPSWTFQKIAQIFLPSGQSGFQGIHPTAVIHPSAQMGKGVSIGPYSVVDRDVSIGDGTILGPHVAIGYETKIGKNCYLHPSSVVRERCYLGDRVILQPGAIIGSCGFGLVPDERGRFQKLEQMGTVILEDDVEIGANTTIDRSRFKATIVRRGSKIDNLCQIAHNVEIGEDNAIAAQTGIAGSSKTGKHVLLGGQTGMVGHVELADHVMVASRGGISKSLKKGGKYRGSPAIPIDEYHRQEVHVRKLAEYFHRLKELEKKIESLNSI